MEGYFIDSLENLAETEHNHPRHVGEDRNKNCHSEGLKCVPDEEDVRYFCSIHHDVVSLLLVLAVFIQLLLVQPPHLLHKDFIVQKFFGLHQAEAFDEVKNPGMAERKKSIEGEKSQEVEYKLAVQVAKCNIFQPPHWVDLVDGLVLCKKC